MILLTLLLLGGLPSATAESLRPSCAHVFEQKTQSVLFSVEHNQRTLTVFRKAKKEPAPVVIYFHGSNVPTQMFRESDAPYGLVNESLFIQKLVDAGYVVIAPMANKIVPYYIGPPVFAWEANISPYSNRFESSRDYLLTVRLLESLPEATGAIIDSQRVFLAGFSSGGYMASRLALDPFIAPKIRGLIVHSASYGHCVGHQCSIPRELPPWHPQTLLVANHEDSIVPFHTVELYENRLRKNHILTETLYSQGDHAWREDHPQLILDWMKSR